MVASKGVPESEILDAILNGDTADLHKLSDLRSYRPWDYSWPTLTQKRRFTARHTYASDEAFFEAIRGHNHGASQGLLEAVGAFDADNHVVLHGGALVDVILKRESEIRDWDMRLVGEKYADDPEACIQAAKTFVGSVFSWLKSQNEEIRENNTQNRDNSHSWGDESLYDIHKVQVSRTASTITMVIPEKSCTSHTIRPTVLQFTFTPYKSIADLLASSAPHCSRVAIQNNAVVLDAAAKYCLESLCVVLDVPSFRGCQIGDDSNDEQGPRRERVLATEMKRVMKYYDEKGFDVILPRLDVKKLPVRNLKFGLAEVLDLPELIAVYDQIEGNKIMLTDLRLPSQVGRDDGGDFNGYGLSLSYNLGESVHHNIRCLVAGVYDRFQLVTEGEVTAPVFDYSPLLTGRMIDKSYETVREYLVGETFSITKVLQYFSATSPTKVLEQAVMVAMEKETVGSTGKVPGKFVLDKDALDKLIAIEKEALGVKLKTIRQTMQASGLDQIVVGFSTSTTSDDKVLHAIYGDCLLEETV